jgi:hypothetical protein
LKLILGFNSYETIQSGWKAESSARSNSEISVGTNFMGGHKRTLPVYSCVIQKLKACYVNPDIKNFETILLSTRCPMQIDAQQQYYKTCWNRMKIISYRDQKNCPLVRFEAVPNWYISSMYHGTNMYLECLKWSMIKFLVIFCKTYQTLCLQAAQLCSSLQFFNSVAPKFGNEMGALSNDWHLIAELHQTQDK